MKYIGNIVLTNDNISGDDYRKIVDFVESLTEEQRDMIAVLQDMYDTVTQNEREYDMMDHGWEEE